MRSATEPVAESHPHVPNWLGWIEISTLPARFEQPNHVATTTTAHGA
jgi:hypothetical protein